MAWNTKKFSNKQERRVAKGLGARVQLGSGCIQSASLKADVSLKDELKILFECKTKAQKGVMQEFRSMSIKKDWLLTVKQQALDGGYDMGVLVFSFGDGKDYYTLSELDFQNLVQEVKDLRKLVADLQKEE